MARRVVFRGFAAVGAFALVAVFAVTAVAQAVPLRVVQGSDGTLYLVQGANSWTLVPDQIGDADLAALNLSGEVDGTIPSQFLTAAPPQAATAPAAPAASAPAPPAVIDPIVGDYNVTYGAQSVVTIDGTGGSYTVAAKSPLTPKSTDLIGFPPAKCNLPPGTIIATFSQSGDTYTGQHGTWKSDCAFVGWVDLNLTLKGSLLTGDVSSPIFNVGGYSFPKAVVTFSRVKP